MDYFYARILQGLTYRAVLGCSFPPVHWYSLVHERINSRLIIEIINTRHQYGSVHLQLHVLDEYNKNTNPRSFFRDLLTSVQKGHSRSVIEQEYLSCMW